MGMTAGFVKRSGTWYSLAHPEEGEIRLGQGQERARTFLIDNPDLADALDGWIRETLVQPTEEEVAKEKEAEAAKASAKDSDPAADTESDLDKSKGSAKSSSVKASAGASK